MKEFLTIFQIVVSLVLIGLILMQARGTGLGRTFGGGSGTSFTRRGLEKLLFRATFVFVVLFLVLSVLSLLF
ncbi:MAG: Preprotein translocase, SecG subunit [Candidatus Woesebacteria bacterium GW2011_GWB1_45_5]|uniref:Protein-export membrane protein SecG n=1 Tax=Candidatus Woesebacteria bacterium GW2011_GWB1_45_5 TaxID=1618581 RepID=A0A0G1MMR3_9BACT|nr:MAG: Preprotein translocase, SecG subunit [Candidatus Woesebacteria bacterium GW2011_GWB1_45_5]